MLKSYFYKTVRNASIDWVKKAFKTRSLEEEIVDSNLSTENLAFQFDLVIEAETLNRLSTAVDKLSGQANQVMKMIYFEGKKIREVAEALGVSQSTVKTQKARALIKLRKSFNN